jgi:lactoylglutathione lyase
MFSTDPAGNRPATREDGYAVLDGPRRTGDGYYESVVLDPDGNRVEVTV